VALGSQQENGLDRRKRDTCFEKALGKTPPLTCCCRVPDSMLAATGMTAVLDQPCAEFAGVLFVTTRSKVSV
jgi:hypothetical protein